MKINRKKACADMKWAVVQRDERFGESVAALLRIREDADELAGWLRGLGWEASVVAIGGDAR